MPFEAALALIGAVLIDRIFGEPRERMHPTVYMGRVIALLGSRLPQGFAGGMLLLLLVTLGFSLPAFLLLALIPWAGMKLLMAAVILKLCMSWRGLADYTLPVKRALEGGNLTEARALLPYIVSRDPSRLGREEISSACVESIAENSVDAVAAPLLYFTIFSFFSLELGVAAALAYRAVNTLDAMVGYPGYGAFGAPSAKLDDLLNFPVARLFAIFLLLSTLLIRASLRGALETLRSDRRKPASPNAGIPMSTVAGALEIRLTKPGHYSLGSFESEASARDIKRALKIVDVALLIYAVSMLLVLLIPGR
ncbi:adenosylcobinamide-phosphate synthase CbiB [Candidatus Pyrohabitans sp.]